MNKFVVIKENTPHGEECIICNKKLFEGAGFWIYRKNASYLVRNIKYIFACSEECANMFILQCI